MIDFTVFGFTLMLRLVGVGDACLCGKLGGADDAPDGGRGDGGAPLPLSAANMVRLHGGRRAGRRHPPESGESAA